MLMTELHLKLLDLSAKLFLLGKEDLNVLLLLGDHLDEEHRVLHLLCARLLGSRGMRAEHLLRLHWLHRLLLDLRSLLNSHRQLLLLVV